MKKIGLNSYFASKPYVGFGVVTNGLIKSIINSDRSDEYVFYSHKFIPHSEEYPKNIHPVILDSGSSFLSELKFKAYWEYFQVSKDSKKRELDVFHSPYPSLVRPRCKKYIVSLLDLIYRGMPECNVTKKLKLYNRLTELVAAKADIIHTISEASKDEIIKYLKIPEEKIRVVYPGISDAFYYDEKLVKEDIINRHNIPTERFILYSGGYDKRKNVKFLLDVFSKLIKKVPDLSLVLVGKIPTIFNEINMDYKEYVSELMLSDKVIFTGILEEPQMRDLYNTCDLFMFPSIYEGFGLTPIEAMRCKAPVVVSNRSSMPEVCGDGAEYINPDKFDDVVRMLTELLNNDNKLNELRAAGLKVSLKYDQKTCYNKITDLYYES